MIEYLQMAQQARMQEIERDLTQRRRFAHAARSQSRLAQWLRLPARKSGKQAA